MRLTGHKTDKKVALEAGFAVFLLLLVACKVFLFRFGNLDEIWHYNICRGISMGFMPYRDINLVGMPLYYLIFTVPVLFVRKMVSYRIFEALLIFGCSYLLFVIARRECGFGYGAIIALVSCLFTDITSYNNLLFFFILLIFQFNRSEVSFGRNVWLGIFTALGILSRQTSGVVVFIFELAYLVYERRKGRGSKMPAFFAGFLGVNLLFLVYLIATSSFALFWDYCFLGLFSYSNVLKGSDIWGIPMLVITLLLLIGEWALLRKEDNFRTVSHMLLTIAALTIAIPTCDMTHAVFAFLMALLPLMLIVKANIGPKLKPVVGVSAAVVLLFSIVRGLIPLISGITFDRSLDELALIPMTGDESGFSDISDRNQNYEAEGKHVIVLSSCSAIVSIYDGSFNPPYDLFLVGSFGSHEAVDILRSDLGPDTVVVMPDDYREENWMNPDGIYELVTSTLRPIDRVGRFVYYAS